MTLDIAVGRCVCGFALAALLAEALPAQETRMIVGAGPTYARATGSLSLYMKGAWGVSGFVAFGPAERTVSLRIDADYLRFTPTTAGRPFRTPQPVLITSGSQVFTTVAGPELRLPLGPVRLSATAGAGFVTSTNTGAVTFVGLPDRATTFADFTLAYAGGVGLGLALGGERTPVWLDLSARYLGTAPTRWVREGNLPIGTISGVYLMPTRSPTTLLAYRLAVSVGVPR